MLVTLASVGIWAVSTTERDTEHVRETVRVSNAFQRAQYALAMETALEREYTIVQSPPTLRRLFGSSQTVDDSLTTILRIGGPYERAIATSGLRQQTTFVSALSQLVEDVQAGNSLQADREGIDRLTSALEETIDAPSNHERAEALSDLLSLHKEQNSIQIVTITTFTLGLALLGIFWWFLRYYNRRVLQKERNARQAETNLRTLVEKLPVAAYVGPLDETASTEYISPEIEAMLGFSRQEWVEDPEFWPNILHPDDRERVMAEHLHHLRTREPFVSEYRMRASKGEYVWVRDQAVIVHDEVADRWYQHGVMINVTEQKRAESALAYQALHDALTDLPNRTLLHDRLNQAILSSRRDGTPLALLLIDSTGSRRSTTPLAITTETCSSKRLADGSARSCVSQTR